MQHTKKCSLVIFILAIHLAHSVFADFSANYQADFSASYQYTATIPGKSGAEVCIKATYSGKYLVECNIHLLTRGAGEDRREFLMNFLKNGAEKKTSYLFRENMGGTILELRMEETVESGPLQMRRYAKSDAIVPPFSDVDKPVDASIDVLDIIVEWANWVMNTTPVLSEEANQLNYGLRQLDIQGVIKRFAKTPFEGYLGK